MQWIHCLSERGFLIVYLFFPFTSKKLNVVPPSTYLYICQVRIRWRFSGGFAKETQRKQCPIHTEFHCLALSLPSSSSVTELPWMCPLHGLGHTGFAIDKHEVYLDLRLKMSHSATKIFCFSWTLMHYTLSNTLRMF